MTGRAAFQTRAACQSARLLGSVAMPLTAQMASSDPHPTGNRVPLCVDLDGTLIRTDTMWEAMRWLVKRNPLRFFSFFIWWAHGRAYLKRQLASRAQLDIPALPYHNGFIEWLKQEKASGRKLVLVTAADQSMGQRVADHVQLFDEVIGSNGCENLRGHIKREHLTKRFGKGGYDYAGNSSVDLQVWPDVHAAIVVNARPGVVDRARRIARVDRVFGKA